MSSLPSSDSSLSSTSSMSSFESGLLLSAIIVMSPEGSRTLPAWDGVSSSSSLTEAWRDGTREEAEVGGDDALDVFTDDPLELSALAYALRDVLDVTVFRSDVFGVFLAWVFAGAFFVGALLEGAIMRGCLSIHPPFFF